MGSGPRTGVTFKTQVLSKSDTELTISVSVEDSGYFEVGHDYLAQFTPTAAGGDDGGSQDQPNP